MSSMGPWRPICAALANRVHLVQGVTTFGAAAAPQLMKMALPVGKKLLTTSAGVLIAGFGAINEAAKKKEPKVEPNKDSDHKSE
jgi:hypothetical protein